MAPAIRLLYVDDEPSLLDIGKLFLEESGNFSVATIDSATAALALLKTEPFDAIVSDYQMPGMDGIRFLVEVRAHFGQIPFILFTGRGREEIVIQAINSGADFYLQKGGDPTAQFSELSHKIRTAVAQRANEAAFKESEERFRAISVYSHSAICIIDAQAKIIWANDKMLELGGYSLDQLYSTESFAVFLAPESVEFVVSNFQKVLLGEPYEHHYSFYFIRADGKKRLCEKHMMDVVDPLGRRNLIISMLDVTDTKQSEEQIRLQADAMEAAMDGLAILNADQNYIYMNKAHTRLYGYDSAEELTGKSWRVLYDASELLRFEQEIMPEFIKKGHYQGRALGKKKDGSIFDQEISLTALANGGLICVVRDITDRKLVDNALHESEEQYRSITESAFDMISLLDLKGCYLYCNPSYATILGYSPGYLTGTNAFTLVHPDDRKSAVTLFLQGLTDKIQAARITLRLICQDGSYKWVDHRCTLITDENGTPHKILLMGQDITELRRADEVLRESELVLTTMISNLPGFVYRCANDRDWTMEYLSDGCRDISGYTPDELLGNKSRSYNDLVLIEYQKPLRDKVQICLEKREVFEVEYPIITKSGETRWVWERGRGIFSEDDRLLYIEGFITDITNRKRAEEALLENSKKYAELFELGGDAIFLIENETGLIIEANAAAGEMYGYSRDAFMRMKDTDLSAEKEEIQKITSETPQGTIRVHQGYHRRNDGTVFPVEILGRFFFWNKRPVHIVSVRDITERKQAEEALCESHDRFEKISEQSRELVWEVDTEGLYTYVSPVSTEIIGFSPGELIGKKHFYDLHPKEGSEAFKASILRIFTQRQVFHDLLNLMQTKDGQIVWMSSNGMPLFDEFNNFLGYRGSDSDITERKQAEEIRTRFGRILESSLNEIYFFDAQTLRFVDVNHGARENLGYSIDELRSMTPLDITTEYTKESFENLIAPLRTGEKDIQVVFTIHKRKDGSLYSVEMHLQLAGNEVSPVFVAIILDITERRLTEEALRLANWKLNLLSGITRHDINNQMTVLRGYIAVLENKQPDPSLNEYIRKMDASAQRISSMIQFTKEYDEIGITLPVWQDIRTLVDAAAKEVSFGEIQLKNDLPDGMEVFSEPLIFKVFYNLMDNAVRYGDTITTIRFWVKDRSGDQIIVCQDDGVGIPADEKEKIFLRGFGKNTGLGLALSQEILEITGISIEETGEPGKGALFEITLPKGMWRMAKGA